MNSVTIKHSEYNGWAILKTSRDHINGWGKPVTKYMWAAEKEGDSLHSSTLKQIKQFIDLRNAGRI